MTVKLPSDINSYIEALDWAEEQARDRASYIRGSDDDPIATRLEQRAEIFSSLKSYFESHLELIREAERRSHD